jgi:hypothetical protein
MRYRCVLKGVELERNRQAFFQTRPSAEEWAAKVIESLSEKQRVDAVVEIYTVWEAIHCRVTVKGIERKRSTGGVVDAHKAT